MKVIILLLLLPLQIFAQEVVPVPLPYLEDFESEIVNQIPMHTYRETITGNSWLVAPCLTGTYNGKVLKYTPAYERANAWFFSKPIYLIAGRSYTIDYLYGNNSPMTIEKFRVTLGIKPNAAAAKIIIEEHTNVKGANLNREICSGITVPQSGIYYIGINARSASYQGELYIDDLMVRE